jgi:hypothetical protein
MIGRRSALGLLFLFMASLIYGQSDVPSPVPPVLHTLTQQQQTVLQTWLAQHPEYRIAEDGDCECADDIKQMRAGDGGVWKAVPDYHPYIATGDFNGDGQQDFAAAVMKRSKKDSNFALLIFNGPFKSGAASPAFIKEGLDLRYRGLFYGPPRKKPYHLVVGRFESDTGSALVPHGRGYRLDE